ncbi:MAG: ABC transporter permease [Chitinophagales bacterium]|nr:ABC transporter permease [Chitinophagales bacterium]
MLHYVLKRILLFIPTLVVISLLAFMISVNAPGDPVSRMMTTAESGDILNSKTEVQLQQKIYWTHKLGLDLPLFYMSMVPLSFPDTLYKIFDRGERSALKTLLHQNGNWNSIEQFHSALKKLYLSHDQLKIDTVSEKQFSKNEINAAINQSRNTTLALLNSSDERIILLRLAELDSLQSKFLFFSSRKNQLTEAKKNFIAMQSSSTCWKNFIPSLHFYSNNQYHRWLFGDGNWINGKGAVYSKGLIRGDLGISFYSKMPVTEIIMDRIAWSLFFTLASVLLAYLISIPIGIRAAVKHGGAFDKTSSVILLMLQSMPAFWVATMLLILFANPDVLNWFPASGVKPVAGYGEGISFFEKVRASFPYLILPLVAYTYSSLAFLSRLTRVSMLEVLQQDYIKTARAKGLSERTVIYKHAFRNALLPLITVFANILPLAIGGSVILESIFTIPGMGYASYFAIQTQDYPVIIGVFTLTGVLTLIGYLLADILYAIADPRISFSKK